MANSFSSAIISASSHNPVSHTVCNYIYVAFPVSCVKKEGLRYRISQREETDKKWVMEARAKKGQTKRALLQIQLTLLCQHVFLILRYSLSKIVFLNPFLSSSFPFP